MNVSSLTPDCISDFSFSQALQDAAPLSTGSLTSHLSGLEHSVQIHDQPHSGYLHHQVTNQEGPRSPRTLNEFSIFDFPSDEHSATFTAMITQKDLDEIVPVDDHLLEGFTKIDLEQAVERSPSTYSSATFTQTSSSPTIALVMPVTEEKQGQIRTKTIKFIPIRPFSLGEPIGITPSKYCSRAYQRSYHWAYRLEMTNSGNKNLARHTGRIAGRIARRAEKVLAKKLLAYYTEQPPGNGSGESCVGTCHGGYWAELTLSDNKAGKVAEKYAQSIFTFVPGKFCPHP